MEKANSRSSSGKLKHRFAQLLLVGSSCSTTIVAAIVGQTNAVPQHPEAEEPGPGRRKHDAGVVRVPVHCSARWASEQFLLPLIPKEEEVVEKEGNETKKESRRVEIGSVNYYDAKQRSKKACGRRTKGRRVEAKKLLSNAYGFTSSSSFNTENELRLFSSNEAPEKEEESGTLFSSKSFSSDSSEFYHHSRKKNKRRSKSMSMKSTRRPPSNHAKHVRGRSCGGIDQLRPLVSISSKETKGTPSAGFAVVTRSCDPYNDFRSSMVEMIVERGMSRGRDLERLLNSYLSLNSPRHHQVILEAFADIWEAIFGK
ncbi:hypothetical protein GW17_00028991 [Ensete ventricosum]|nr:hypothetical protein GW17_00028991 [Ensete ventricosum]